MSTPIPTRFSFAAFSRFAHEIADSLEIWPEPLIITPNSKAEGIAQPLRDAIRGGLRYGYVHPLIQGDKFQSFGPQMVVDLTSVPGKLVLGPRQPRGHARLATARNMEVFVEPKHVPALAPLIAAKALTPMPTFVVTGLAQETIKALEAKHDIAFLPLEENKHEII